MGFGLFERQLPKAVAMECDAMLYAAIARYQMEGYGDLAVDGLVDYRQPEPRRIPGSNIPLLLDIEACAAGKPVVCAMVTTSTVLSDSLWGRRWQGFARICEGRTDTRCEILVHPEDLQNARDLAKRWKLPESLIQPLPRQAQ